MKKKMNKILLEEIERESADTEIMKSQYNRIRGMISLLMEIEEIIISMHDLQTVVDHIWIDDAKYLYFSGDAFYKEYR